jgi:predicted O-methyltransferase YrrM
VKNRQELADFFAARGFTTGAEIGVCNGIYSRVLLDTIPKLTLFAVDCWRRRPSDRLRAEAYLHDYIARQQCRIVYKSSIKAVREFTDGSLDFVFIDADHSYAAVKSDIEGWSPKVRSGGIVSGHDYARRGTLQVIQAVDEYVKRCGLTLHLTDWDRQNPSRDSRQPCWWWEQP